MLQAGGLLILAVVQPLVAVLACFVFGRRATEIAIAAVFVQGLLATAILASVWRGGAPLICDLGGWAPPLGIALRADGLSAVMMVTTAVIAGAIVLYAAPTLRPPPGRAETRAGVVFWTLLFAVCGALTVVWTAGDMFTLYVALELLTFGAVPMVCLDGRAETVAAALRYLLFALLGSVFYLLGTALLYGAYGTLDIAHLAEHVRAEPALWMTAALVTAGLLAKTALFPLHLWLPSAHAGAPAAASALLSSLVVKASFFILLRFWFDVMPRLPGDAAAQLLGALGAAAIVAGSVLSLRQARLKLLVAYSTVAQIGYLFLIFPLAAGSMATSPWSGLGWSGGIVQLIAHAVAKASMFLAAGLIGESLGHDRMDGLGGIARAAPTTVAAFVLAGLSLMGLPPSGGFVAKLLLLAAAVTERQWWWAAVILAGGLLAGGYVFRVLASTLAAPVAGQPRPQRIARDREAVVLALSLCAVLLGLLPLRPLEILQIGRPALAVAAPR